MAAAPARVMVSLLLASYGFLAVGAHGLHEIAPCVECTAAAAVWSPVAAGQHCHGHEHSHGNGGGHDCGESDHTSCPTEGDKPAHDARRCAACQWHLLGQCDASPPETLISAALQAPGSFRTARISLAHYGLPPEVRGPPAN